MEHDVKDLNQADKGKLRIEWAGKFMPVLRNIKKEFKEKKSLEGIKISACLHVTSETANLMETLKMGGAQVNLTASNPLSTQDDVAAALVKHYEIPVFAIKGEDNKTYYEHLNQALDFKPQVTMDDGADLVSTIHSKRKDLMKEIIGGTEETTTGVIRLKSMAKEKVLNYPIIWYRPKYDRWYSQSYKCFISWFNFCSSRLWMVRPGSGNAGPGFRIKCGNL